MSTTPDRLTTPDGQVIVSFWHDDESTITPSLASADKLRMAILHGGDIDLTGVSDEMFDEAMTPPSHELHLPTITTRIHPLSALRMALVTLPKSLVEIAGSLDKALSPRIPSHSSSRLPQT